MKNKIPFMVGSIVIVLAVVVVLIQHQKNLVTPVPTENVSTTITTPMSTTGDVPTDKYTLSVVATHNSQLSCWTTINGGVYDVTSWIGQHPGGEQAILGLCGKDGSAAFNGQHGGEKRPASELASFKIGTLVQ